MAEKRSRALTVSGMIPVMINRDILKRHKSAAVVLQHIDLQAVQGFHVFEQPFFFTDCGFFPVFQRLGPLHHFCRLMPDVSPVRLKPRDPGAGLCPFDFI